MLHEPDVGAANVSTCTLPLLAFHNGSRTASDGVGEPLAPHRESRLMPRGCMVSTLHALMHRPRGCMRRAALPPDVRRPAWLPIYATVVPGVLQHRMDAASRRISQLGAPDVTFIACANREDIEALTVTERACIHPRYSTSNPWAAANRTSLSNGTLSLAVKHSLAYLDVVRRSLPAAIVLEDDALLPSNLWHVLVNYRVPCDAGIFWMTAYRQNLRTFSFGDGAHGKNPHTELAVAYPEVFRRGDYKRTPLIVSTAGYVIFERGARTVLSQAGLVAETDIALSCLLPQCLKNTSGLIPPRPQYGPARWLFGQDNSKQSGGTHSDQG